MGTPTTASPQPPPLLQRRPHLDPSLPEDAIVLTLRHGAVGSESGELTILDALPKSAVVSSAAPGAGGLVLGFATADGSASSMCDFNLGQLRYSRLLACARNKLWWMTPEWRSAGSGPLPPETQFLLLESVEGSGPYALLLPLIDGAFRGTLSGVSPSQQPDNKEVCLRLESGDSTVTESRFKNALYIAAGWDPYELIDRGMAAAGVLSGGARPRSGKVLPPLVDSFGWCTWDAFYSTVSARGLVQGIQSLHDGGVRPGFLIIDDGWQMTGVDPPTGMPNASELAARLKMERAQEILEDTESDYYAEQQEVLGQAAKRMPPGSAAGRLLQPTIENKAPARLHHHHHPHGDPSAPSGTSMGSQSMDRSGASLDDKTNGTGPSSSSSPPAAGAGAPPSAAAAGQNGSGAAANGVSGGGAPGSAAARVKSTQAEIAELAERDAIWLVRVAQKVAGALAGLGSAAFVVIYQWVVEPAAPGSLAVRLFTAAAKGPLKSAMLDFFAASSDFTRRLTSVRANGKFSGPDAGPDSDWEDREEQLGAVVTDIKTRFGIKHVYCWHGLPAYWAGVMPGAPAVDKYKARIVYAEPTPGVLEVEPAMAWNPAVLAGVGVVDDPATVYTDMHRYLAASNVDGVKVDCQAGVGLIGSQLGGGPALSARFQAALEASIQANFADNNCINCMCHSTENLYRMTGTSMVRASDDFYPRDPASSAPHIAACAYNSTFLSALLHPDWDMFQSKHPAARMHAMARAISGGAVYVSDKPGEHDYALLRQLVLADGSVLRAQQPGRPTRDCLFADVMRDGKSLLKVWTTNRHGAVVGVFHLQGSSWDRSKRKFYVHDKAPRALTARVSPRDIEPWRRDSEAASGRGEPPSQQKYALYSFTTGQLRVMGYADSLSVPLASATSDMVTLVPVVEAAGVAFAALGLAGMINSGGAITACEQVDAAGAAHRAELNGASGNGTGKDASGEPAPPVFSVGVRGSGQLLLYASRAPRRVVLSGVEVATTYDVATGKLLLEVPEAAATTTFLPTLDSELLVAF